ncbi:MAG: aldehyde dehydrogenase family protein [Betaproteobacteria bacterium]|nr:aldehyde dehydrogenase family protein [Betaproteobacteria bacterium]NBT74880.1 aldehyde dehydrogenase family protein [Betaproteobacteria bacterium]NCA15478.1 aldehyde dehydrogenase family protein [Betaproteobacteria bacterium]
MAEVEMTAMVETLIKKARDAQHAIDGYTQAQVDLMVQSVAWAMLEPERNRHLAELAVRDSGVGNIDDKFAKNFRKTLGLVRDLKRAVSVGVIDEDLALGITEIARPVGVVAAITPSTNPGATPINKILNALKCRNAIIIAPSPKGASTCQQLLTYVHVQLGKVGAPIDLVQMLPMPISKEATTELMKLADLVVATGSQSNIRQAYSSGTPAFGVGAGNVAVIIDEWADCNSAAEKIAKSKAFDNATSCSSENGVVIVSSAYDRAIESLKSAGGVLLTEEDRARLQAFMFPDGKLSSQAVAQSAPEISRRAGLKGPGLEVARFLMVRETGWGPGHPFSGEKLSPILTVWEVPDFDSAIDLVRNVYAFQGAGHSVGLHSVKSGVALEERARALAERLPVARVIVNQAHAIATGGSFDNGLPFSLSMGCGTWGRNNFSENLNYRHYLNITRIARPIPEVVPSVDDLLSEYFEKFDRG